MSSSHPSARFGTRTVDRTSAWLARSDLMTTASIDPSGRAAASCVVRSAGRPDRRPAARAMPSRRAVPGWALAAAGLSPILLVGAWLVADSLQPGSYSPVRDTVSALAGHAATHRWIMSCAMCLVATCYLLAALGLAGLRTSARVVLAVAGVSGIGIAASPEPTHGATPQHLVWTAVGAVAITAWPAFVASRTPPRPRPLVLSIHGAATVTAIFVALLGWVLIETDHGSVLGLAEPMTTAVQISWPFVVALALRRSQPHRIGEPGSTETRSRR